MTDLLNGPSDTRELVATETAGHAIVRTLEEHGIPRAYVVPGESYLEVLDGLHGSSIDTIVTRQEGGAAYMADAEGKLSDLPGIVMVTRGPGAANALVGIHAAWQDSTPVVLFIGLIPKPHRQREAFQEFDIQGWFERGAKRVFVLDSAERASEITTEALFAARSGRPGPVVVGLPEDIIRERIAVTQYPPIPVATGGISRSDATALRDALGSAQKPLVVTGGSDWTPEASNLLTGWLEHAGIAAAAEWRTEGVVSWDSPSYVGPVGYGRPKPTYDLFAETDLVIFIGTLPGDVLTSYIARQDWASTNFLVSMDPMLRGRSGAVSHQIVAKPASFVRDLVALDIEPHAEWSTWTAKMRAQQESFAALPEPGMTGPARMDSLMAHLVPALDDDAIVTLGAGEHTNWAHRYFPVRQYPAMVSAGNGSMGYSIPSAVAASLEFPERQVVTIAGDGEFLMNGQELATARQYGATPLVVVMDNAEYGTIRTHQERQHPDRVSGTQLVNPDFAAHGRRVRRIRRARRRRIPDSACRRRRARGYP